MFRIMRKYRTDVGKFLAKIRIDNEDSMSDMADKIGIHKNNLYSIEQGKRDISLKLFKKIVDVYKLKDEDVKEFYITMVKSNKKLTVEHIFKLNEKDLSIVSKILSDSFCE